jgi:hypothetical protein
MDTGCIRTRRIPQGSCSDDTALSESGRYDLLQHPGCTNTRPQEEAKIEA